MITPCIWRSGRIFLLIFLIQFSLKCHVCQCYCAKQISMCFYSFGHCKLYIVGWQRCLDVSTTKVLKRISKIFLFFFSLVLFCVKVGNSDNWRFFLVKNDDHIRISFPIWFHGVVITIKKTRRSSSKVFSHFPLVKWIFLVLFLSFVFWLGLWKKNCSKQFSKRGHKMKSEKSLR